MPNTAINFPPECVVFWNFIFDINLTGAILKTIIINFGLISFFQDSQLVTSWLTFDLK